MNRQSSVPDSVAAIPITKLRPPQLADHTLHRPQPIQELHRAVTSCRLTLLAAPAGAGKTTAVTTLHATFPQLPLAWVALDEGDDTPHAFVLLLVAAVQQVAPTYGLQVQQILEMGNPQEVDTLRLTGLLINEMAAKLDTPFLIVLDDLHRISDKEIYTALDYLLERLPPGVHLIITTRYDPPLRLAQLRARGQLAELRLADLRFSSDEVARLFQKMHHLDLTPVELELIQACTDGWPAGLHLLSLSMSRLESTERRSDFLRHLSTSQRYLFDYLIEEVLNQLHSRDREFLLQSAILDELTPRLCQSVTGQVDAALTLDRLYRQNLFLTLTDTADPLAEPTYRPHALFSQVLQKQLLQSGADVAQLHRRAADATSIPARRIHHLLAAAAWHEAAEAIIDLGRLQCEREFVHSDLIEWMEKLPASVRADHYWLDLIRANYLKQQGKITDAWQMAKAVYVAAQANEDTAAEFEALWTLVSYLTEQRETAWQERFEALVAARPDLLSPLRRCYYLMSRAWQTLYGQGWAAAQPYFFDYLQTAAATGHVQLYYSAAQHIGPQWFFTDQGIEPVRRFDQAALHLLREEEGLPQAGIYVRQAWIHLLQGNLPAVEPMAQRAGRIFRLMGNFAWMDLVVDWALLNGMIARSEVDRLETFVQAAEKRLSQVDTHRQHLPEYWLALWRAYWLQDRWEEAAAIRARLEAMADKRAQPSRSVLALLDGWQAYADERLSQAEEFLLAATRFHREQRWVGTWGHPGLDLALFYLLQERPQQALDAWRKTAIEMQQREMPGLPLLTGRKIIPMLELACHQDVYAEIAQVSLDAFGVGSAPRSIPIPNSDEWLTPREAEVLQLLLNGATNQQIADQLIITRRTAKAHVSNILQKLGASSRAEAIARAHDLALFP